VYQIVQLIIIHFKDNLYVTTHVHMKHNKIKYIALNNVAKDII